MAEVSIEIPALTLAPPVPPTTIGDLVIAQGDTHFICQDYAATGSTEEGDGWMVVCDGCSGAPDTDWGARLLTKAAQRQIQLLRSEEAWEKPELWKDVFGFFFEEAIEVAETYAHRLGVNPYSLTATTLVARTYRELLLVGMYGDGILTLRERATGAWHLASVSFADGKASYPSYILTPETLDRFRALPGNERIVAQSTIPEGGAPIPDGNGEDFVYWVFDRNTYDIAALLTDGGTSFTRLPEGKHQREPIPAAEALADLLDYPRTTAGFVRRSYQFAKKDWAKRGWKHYDDLTLAALYLIEQERPADPEPAAPEEG